MQTATLKIKKAQRIQMPDFDDLTIVMPNTTVRGSDTGYVADIEFFVDGSLMTTKRNIVWQFFSNTYRWASAPPTEMDGTGGKKPMIKVKLSNDPARVIGWLVSWELFNVGQSLGPGTSKPVDGTTSITWDMNKNDMAYINVDNNTGLIPMVDQASLTQFNSGTLIVKLGPTSPTPPNPITVNVQASGPMMINGTLHSVAGGTTQTQPLIQDISKLATFKVERIPAGVDGLPDGMLILTQTSIGTV
jgi:hypothetical protein